MLAPAFAQVTINDSPSREFGHLILNTPITSAAPNLVEGRELNGPSGIAFDYSVNPPAVYVADTQNNRVLGWKNSAAVANGAKADIVIGQRDFTSTFALGPGTSLSTGLYLPLAVAVDSKGNLYVLDAGNNRILRYPTPFSQTGGLLPVDLVIGQQSVSSGNSANQCNCQTPSSQTLFFSNAYQLFRAGLAFDSQGNLWVTDPGNNRVLRYPAANLGANNPQPAANLVLGQFDFTSYNPLPCGGQCTNQFGTNPQLNQSGMTQPSSVAIDAAGRVYVADIYARVMEFDNPGTNGASANHILGIRQNPQQQGQGPAPYPNDYTLGALSQNGSFTGTPYGVFTLGANVFVCDTPQNRVVSYIPANWGPPSTATPSPQIAGVLGQPDLFSGKVNRNLLEPNSSSLNAPIAGAANAITNEVWIADSGNNRILIFPQTGPLLYSAATRVLGQLDFPYGSPNLIEGREAFFSTGNVVVGAGIVVDKNSNPPHLYIADTGNHRVLGFADARRVGTDAHSLLTQKADLVIGQPDLLRSLQNYSPNNVQPSDALTPNNSGLNQPTGLAVAANGDLFVADSGNGRVLRFPAPFAQGPGLPHANLVLGQSSFTNTIKDPSAATMNTPYGLALFNDGSLAVSDVAHNRILIFQKPAGGDFTNGQAASIVLGQSNFSSIAPGNTSSSLNNPRHIATDSSDRLYVCDTQNNRILVFTNASKSFNGASAALVVPGLNQPEGIAVSRLTGESWVANLNASQILRFPEFVTLQGTLQPIQTINSYPPVAIALDQFDNVIVAEASNRLSFYFPRMFYRHAATFSSQVPLSPGMLVFLGRWGSDYSFAAAGDQATPWPTAGLNDVAVTVNGTPAPIFRLASTYLGIQVPMSAPQGGTADFVVFRPSSGQILSASTFAMQPASPGIFTANASGTLQASAINQDGTYNSGGNPAARGSVISLYLTGAGFIPGLPPDGTPPNGAIQTPIPPKVYINGIAANVQYSGTSPQFPGEWQINVQIPPETPPGNKIWVLVTMDDYPSNIGGTGTNPPGPDQSLVPQNGLIPTIAVK